MGVKCKIMFMILFPPGTATALECNDRKLGIISNYFVKHPQVSNISIYKCMMLGFPLL